MTPQGSFVIPAYNAQNYLSQAILSCREQSVKDIEIIVVNDGSTDGTQELAEWHASQDKRIRCESFPENRGRSAARNHGNTIAQSPYIFVLDADDMACRNRVKDTLGVFYRDKPDIVYGAFQLVDEFGNLLDKVPAGPFNRELAVKRRLNFIGHSTMAYRQGITRNVRYDEGDYSRLGLDDWKFQWDAFLAGYKMSHCKAVLSQYRVFRDKNGLVQTTTLSKRDDQEVLKVKDAYLAQINSPAEV